jgi:hypothetical protein
MHQPDRSAAKVTRQRAQVADSALSKIVGRHAFEPSRLSGSARLELGASVWVTADIHGRMGGGAGPLAGALFMLRLVRDSGLPAGRPLR